MKLKELWKNDDGNLLLDTRLSSDIQEEHRKSENKTYYHLYWRWEKHVLTDLCWQTLGEQGRSEPNDHIKVLFGDNDLTWSVIIKCSATSRTSFLWVSKFHPFPFIFDSLRESGLLDWRELNGVFVQWLTVSSMITQRLILTDNRDQVCN